MKHIQTINRLLAVTLAVILLMSLLPLSAFAEEDAFPLEADAEPTSPEWAEGYPKASSIGDKHFNLVLKSKEDGSAYYVRLPQGAASPTAEQVAEGEDAAGSKLSYPSAYALSVTADIEKAIVIRGLTPDTAYDVYVVLEDGEGNLQESPELVQVTTTVPDDANSGITGQHKDINGSKRVQLTVTVKNADGNGSRGYSAVDFSVKIDGMETAFDGPEFSNFNDLPDNGTYYVVFTGDADNTEYTFTDLTVSGVVIEAGPTTVTTPPPEVVSEDPPTITSAVMDAENDLITITFSEEVYGDAAHTKGINEDDFNLIFAQNGGEVSEASIRWLNSTSTGVSPTGGETQFDILLKLVDGPPSGTETITISPKANSIYSSAGVVVPTTESTGAVALHSLPGQSFADGYPKPGAPQPAGSHAIQVLVKASRSGVLYHVVLPDGATPPTAQQIKDHGDIDGSPVIGWGQRIIAAGTETSVTMSGNMNHATSYDIYMLAEAGNNNFSQAVKLELETPPETVMLIDIPAISGVTAPVTGEIPVTGITETAQYTGTVLWSPGHNPFEAGRSYTATITLMPKSGYTLTGIPADFFTVEGATTTNAGDSGVVTAVFPETAAEAAAPTVQTDAITAITDTGALLSGNVSSEGSSSVTERGFVYDTSSDPDIGSGIKITAGSGTGVFFAVLSGLAADTTYHVRAYAANSEGTAYGANVSFTTVAAPTDPDIADVEKAIADLTFDTIKLNNTAANNIVSDLNLYTEGSSGTSISWSSSNPEYIAANGKVIRPAEGIGDQSVTLTAAISKGSAGNSRTFSLVVKALPAITITGIAVKTQPSDLVYKIGENLNLADLVVTLTYSDSSTEDIALGSFAARNITVSPANGTKLSAAHHNKPVMVSCSGKTASINNLTVTAAGTGGNEGNGRDDGGRSSTSKNSKPLSTAKVVDSNGDIRSTITARFDSSTGTVSVEAAAAALATAFNSSQADENGLKTVEVYIPKTSGAKAYASSLPAVFLTSGDTSRAVKLETPLVAVTIPGNMLTAADASGVQTVTLTVASGDKGRLSADVQSQIGSRPILELNLKIDGSQYDWSNENAPVTISIPYVPTSQELANSECIVIWYIDGRGNVVSVPNGCYNPITGTVTFTATHFSSYAVGYNKVSFKDVAANAWYNKAVSFVAARGIAIGTGNGNFSPEVKLTRGQFIVMMMNAYGLSPDADQKLNFSDAGNTYYTGYLAAAKRLGISKGVGNNLFAPENQITHQEMFTLLYNALQAIGKLPQVNSGKLSSDIINESDIAPWAKDAMLLLAKTGALGSSNEKLNPTDITNRAQMAQVLYKLLSK